MDIQVGKPKRVVRFPEIKARFAKLGYDLEDRAWCEIRWRYEDYIVGTNDYELFGPREGTQHYYWVCGGSLQQMYCELSNFEAERA
jgi:hypothetical protein